MILLFKSDDIFYYCILRKPLPSDNFEMNNKNVTPSKYILVFDIQIKASCVYVLCIALLLTQKMNNAN